jgi:hypothetical protein
MADIIKTIGASGADYTTIAAWWAARSGGAGDKYIGVLIDAADYAGGEFSGTYAGDSIELYADAPVKLALDNPSGSHARIVAGAANALYWRCIKPTTVTGVEIYTASTAQINVKVAEFEDTNITFDGCWLRGGSDNLSHTRATGLTKVKNSVISDGFTFGVKNNVAGVTLENVALVRNNTSSTSFRGGCRKDVAGTMLTNVVAVGNNVVDFFGSSTLATVSYLASSDSSASGSNAITAVTTAAFTDYAGNIFTAAASDVLDNTGPGGTDRGINLSVADNIVISSVAPWALFQRDAETNTGSIPVSGTYSGAPTSIEARFNGGAWVVLDAAPAGGTFSGTLTGLAAGNGALEVRYSNDTGVTDSVANVAIGAKFLFWGQSNFSGRATNAQSYTGTAGWFHKYTVTNGAWQEGADPFDTDTASGSLFPLLASDLTDLLGCPVAFIGVAAGSTTLAQWQSGQTLNTRMLSYISSAADDGLEAVVSWIGESDASAATAEVDFKARYNAVIDQLYTLTSAKSLLVAISGLNNTDYANVRQWISDIAAANDNAYDDEVQMWPLFQGIHYVSDTETGLASDAIFDAMSATYIEPIVSSLIAYDIGEFSFVAESNLAFQRVASYDIGDFSVSVITDQSGVDINSTINFDIGSFGFYVFANNGASQQIPVTEITQSSEISEIDVTSVAEFIYSEGMTLFIQNNGESAISPAILGTESGLFLVKGVGYVDLSGGFSVGSIEDGGMAAISLDTVRHWLRGTARLVDAAGCSVFILIK